MIKIEKVEVVGWEHAIRAMRNPLNSWGKSDTSFWCYPTKENINPHLLGENDLNLMKKLAKGGSDHAKYRRMIVVYADITAPLYWWKEFDTYKVGTVANSCSTMHKIHDKEFTLNDFSFEHLGDLDIGDGCKHRFTDIAEDIIKELNLSRKMYIASKNKQMKSENDRLKLMKEYWWQMIQLLPSSYNQKRTVMLNYEVLASIYKQRRYHKLDEWQEFCDWIETLPHSELITGERK